MSKKTEGETNIKLKLNINKKESVLLQHFLEVWTSSIFAVSLGVLSREDTFCLGRNSSIDKYNSTFSGYKIRFDDKFSFSSSKGP